MEEATRRVGLLSRLRLGSRSIRVALTAGLIMVALSGCTGGGSAQGGSSSTSGWTTHRDARFSLEIPSAWQVSSDSHTGRIDAAGSNGDRVEILPFFTRASLTPAAATAVLQGLGSSLEPTAQWQAPTPAGASTARMSGTLA